MSCMAVSMHVRWGRCMGLEWPGMECAKSSCLTMTSIGLRAACPSHLTLPPHIICHRQPLWKVTICAPCAFVRAHDFAAPYMSRVSTRDL